MLSSMKIRTQLSITINKSGEALLWSSRADFVLVEIIEIYYECLSIVAVYCRQNYPNEIKRNLTHLFETRISVNYI